MKYEQAYKRVLEIAADNDWDTAELLWGGWEREYGGIPPPPPKHQWSLEQAAAWIVTNYSGDYSPKER